MYCTPFRLIFFVLISFLFSSCQSDNKPERAVATETRIYANYYIRYSHAEKEIKAEAAYLEGDSIQNRKPKQFSTVLFGSEKMALNEINSKRPYYQITAKKASPKEVHFRFTNDKGVREEDHIELPGISSFSIPSPIQRANGSQLSWKGTPLQKGESIVLLFTDEQNRTTSMMLNGPSSSTQLEIPSAKIKKLRTGKNKLYLVRKGRRKSQQDTRDPKARVISTVTEYYSGTIDVEVE